MLDTDQLKVALDDARARQTALLQLIYFTDQQAMSLLRLYVTIAVATATGAATGFAPNSWIPMAASIGLTVVSIALLVGCYFCFQAMKTAELALPGRGADFWKAVVTNNVDFAYAAEQYLDELESRQVEDQRTNKRSAKALHWAKLSGAAAPFLALAVAALATLLLRYFS